MPSLSVTLSTEEYAELAKVAKKEKKTPNAMATICVRSYLDDEVKA